MRHIIDQHVRFSIIAFILKFFALSFIIQILWNKFLTVFFFHLLFTKKRNHSLEVVSTRKKKEKLYPFFYLFSFNFWDYELTVEVHWAINYQTICLENCDRLWTKLTAIEPATEFKNKSIHMMKNSL